MSGPSSGHRSRGRLVRDVAGEERGRTVDRGHHWLQTAPLELVRRYLTHRRGGAAVAGSGTRTNAAAAAGRAHCVVPFVAGRRPQSVCAAGGADTGDATATTAATATGRSV